MILITIPILTITIIILVDLIADVIQTISVYSIRKSPYGWSPRELRASFIAVSPNEFTYDYVSNKVAEVYAIFPNEEIHDLLTKVKQENG